jgi:hypothetical protein
MVVKSCDCPDAITKNVCGAETVDKIAKISGSPL